MPPPEHARRLFPLRFTALRKAEWCAALIFFGAGCLMAWFSARWHPAVRLAVGAVAAVALLALLRRAAAWLLGPVFFYDLLCAARRGRYILIRCAYALCLLGAVCGLYVSWFGGMAIHRALPQDEMPRFATSVFLAFLATQLLAVLLLTPVFTGSAVAEEKERRRLDFLLITELTDHEIVLGKFASRLATIGLMLLTGLPVLGFIQLLGGVDPNLVLAGFAATLCMMLSVGGLGVWASTLAEKPSTAMWVTYLTLVCYLGFCWCPPGLNLGHPGTLYVELERALDGNRDLADVLAGQLGLFAGFHVTVCGVCLVLAIGCVRPEKALRIHARPRSAGELRLFALPAREGHGAPLPLPRGSPLPGPFGLPRLPPVDENRPLLWKELHLDQGRSQEALRVLIYVGGMMLLFVVLMIGLTALLDALQRHKPIGTVTNPMARIIGSVVGCFMLLGILLTAAGSVSREREQHTLESLLTLPLERADILWAKWLGGVLSVRRIAYGLAGMWLFAMATGGLHLFAVALLVPAFAAYAGFAASLGLYFSVSSPSTVQATLRALLTLFALLAGSVLGGRELAYTTPMASLWMLAFGPGDRVSMRHDFSDFETEPAALVMGLLGAVAYGLAGLLLWLRACARFRREAR